MLDDAPRARPGAAPGSGRPARCRRAGAAAARPRRGTARSWVAACRIHSARADGVVERGEVGAAHRVDQPGAGALAAQLDQVGALAVAVARGALGVDRRPGPSPAARRRRPRASPRSVSTTVGTPSAGSCSGTRGAVRCRRRGRLAAVVGAHQRAGPGRATTPSGSGGRPAMVHSRSAQASRCVADVGPERRPARRGPPSRRWPAGRPSPRSSARPPGSRCRPRRRSRRRVARARR